MIKHETKYEIKGPGLFVIIRNDRFPFDKEKAPLNYKHDQERVLEAFKLLKEDGTPVDNVFIGENLRKEEGRDAEIIKDRVYRYKSFDSFITAVKEYKVNNNPAFVMFLLMSHGHRDGRFLLSYEKPCDYNSQEYASHWRSAPTDIIKPIQETYKQIPKIFILQTCRGGDARDALKMSGGDHDEVPVPENLLNYIPPASGTFILYPCGEGEQGYVYRVKDKNGGSLLVEELLVCIEDLERALSAMKDQQKIIEAMNAPLTGTTASKICLEDLMDGWLMDICRKTSDLVAKRYMWERKYK